MRDDARLLSLLEKRRGRKGFRELQGETLRLSLSDISATLVSGEAPAIVMPAIIMPGVSQVAAIFYMYNG